MYNIIFCYLDTLFNKASFVIFNYSCVDMPMCWCTGYWLYLLGQTLRTLTF